jgi:anti-anti-sigma factor
MDTVAYEHLPGNYAIVHETTESAEILHVFGDLDLVSSPDFEAKMVSNVRIGKLLVVNLLECKYIDSSALGALIRARRVVGARLRVVIGQGGNVDRVFRITAMEKFFPVHFSLEHALADSIDSGAAAAS